MPSIIQVRLQARSLVPADDSVNVFHTTGDPSEGDDAVDLAAAIVSLYQALGSTSPTPQIFGQQGNGNGEVRVYNFDDPQPRVPLHMADFTYNAGGGSIPTQVAAAVSYRGDLVPGINRARRRGRTFLPWINQTALELVSNRPQFSSAMINKCVDAFEDWAQAVFNIGTPLSHEWAVYSRTDNVFVPIRHIWMTSGPDVIRSRKQDSTLRAETDVVVPGT
jgi:hypothetical protein